MEVQNNDHDHQKGLDWPGWAIGTFALEIQQPWSDLLLKRKKSIEVRAYPLPISLLQRKVYILGSSTGVAGKSLISNIFTLKNSCDVKIVGWVVFESVKEYRSAVEFSADEDLHLVSPNDPFGWNPEKTSVLFGWRVSQVEYLNEAEENFEVAVRKMRSLFQLYKSL